MSTDFECAKKIFSSYDYVSKLGEEKILELIDISMNYGAEKAKMLLKNNRGKELPEQLLLEEGITIDWEETPSGDQRFVKFAQCAIKTKTITINRHAVSLLSDAYEDLSFDSVKNSIIAHELYHYYEDKYWGYLYKQYIFERKIFGLFNFKYSVLPMSEVAANAFSKTLLKLDFNPYELTEKYFACIS